MRTLFLLISLMIPVWAGVEKKPVTGVDVALVSENASIAAGETFRVGLKIHHHEGYHTYWKNPGIAGVPTKLEWQLPEGFSAGPIQWPFPEKSLMAGHPVHGYERDVILLVDIKAPAGLDRADVTLKATASWMACAKGCYPGNMALELTLPVAPTATTHEETAAVFAKTAEELPQPLRNWTAEVVSAKDAPEVRLRLKPVAAAATQPRDVYFFSSDGQVSSNKPQRVEIEQDGSLVITTTRSDESPKGKMSLPGVLVSADPWNEGGARFVSIDPAFPAIP